METAQLSDAQLLSLLDRLDLRLDEACHDPECVHLHPGSAAARAEMRAAA